MSTPIVSTSSKPQGRFISLQFKLILGFTLIFTLVFASTYYWFYDFANNEAKDQIKRDLYNTIKGATETGILNKDDKVQIVNGDEMEGLIKEGVRLASDGLSDDPRYWNQVQVLCEIRRVEPRASLYTYIKSDKPNEIIFITSWGACSPDSGPFASFREPYDVNVGPNLAGLNQIVFQTKTGWCVLEDANCEPYIYSDKFGSWISAYAPIRNSKGEAVAALGIDFTSTYVNEVRQQILNKIYLAFAVTYIILLVLVYFVSQVLTRPMVGLTRAAEQIGEGNYEVGLKYLNELDLSSNKSHDEIGTMERVFRSMIDKVNQREQTLRRQVEELKIVIDESKKNKQVEDIVDSEFFQELKVKAQKMRLQHSQKKQD
ncbi:MAG: HAMP domain-containing protein [Anaerolineales bacterium]